MSLKRKLVRLVVDSVDSWNKEVHQALEEKVSAAYKQHFPQYEASLKEKNERMNDMRSYYKAGMTTTASLLVAAVALFIAVIALLVAVLQLF